MKVKEESEKVGLKFNIHETKIMASGPIPSWEIDGKQWKQCQTLFLGLQDYCTTPTQEGFFCGAGDVFASAFLASLLNGKTESEAVALAAEFSTACIERSAKEVPDKRYGLPFEKELFPFLEKLRAVK